MIYTKHSDLFLPSELVNRLKEWSRSIAQGEVVLEVREGRIVAWRLTECGCPTHLRGRGMLDKRAENT